MTHENDDLEKQIDKVFEEFYSSLDAVGRWVFSNWVEKPVHISPARQRNILQTPDPSSNYSLLSHIFDDISGPEKVVYLATSTPEDIPGDIVDRVNENIELKVQDGNQYFIDMLGKVAKHYNDLVSLREDLADEIKWSLEKLQDYVQSKPRKVVNAYVNELKKYLILFGDSLEKLGEALGEDYKKIVERPINEKSDSLKNIPAADRQSFAYMSNIRYKIGEYERELSDGMIAVVDFLLSDDGMPLDKFRIIGEFETMFRGMHFMTAESSLRTNIETLFKTNGYDIDKNSGQDESHYRLNG